MTEREQEVQVRVPFSVLGEDWEDLDDRLQDAFHEAVEESGLGMVDDPDHWDDWIYYYLIGPDPDRLVPAARQVLVEQGVLEGSYAFLADPDADDMEVGRRIEF